MGRNSSAVAAKPETNGFEKYESEIASIRSFEDRIPEVYEQDEKAPVYEVQPNDYDLDEIDGKYGPFQVVRFSWGKWGEKSTTVRNNKTHPCEVDDDLPVKICRFVANRNFDCSNGTVIKQGTPKWFAIQ